jgi:hypothetical protein
MRLDNRSADRKSHAYAVGFRREEGLEDAISGRQIDTQTSVLNCHKHAVRVDRLRRYRQHFRTIHDHAHGFNAIQDQIEHDLLQLNPVSEDHLIPR